MYGEAETRPPLADGKGVMLMLKNKFPHTLGAERRRAACRKPANLFPAASMGGRASWPPVRLTCGKERCGAAPRGQTRDDIEQSADRETGVKKVFIKNLQDVAHRSFELYPENSEDLKTWLIFGRVFKYSNIGKGIRSRPARIR